MRQPSYAYGVPNSPLLGQTIGETLRQMVEKQPDSMALVVRHQRYRATYRQLWVQTTVAAKALLGHGVQRGDRVAVWAPNRFEWSILQFATARIGAILVCVNPGYSPEGVEHAMALSGTSLLFTAATFEGKSLPSIIGDARARLPELRQVYELDTQWVAFLQFAGQTSDEQLAERESQIQFDDPVNIQFTSGSTGRPKGVLLTHFGLVNNARSIGGRMQLTSEDRTVCPAQYFHIMCNTLGMLACVTHGACMCIPSEVYDPISTLELIQKVKATAYVAVPTMYIGVLNHPRFKEFDVSSLRTGIMAGAPCPIEVMRRVETELHMPQVTICYGMTETSPVACQTRIDAPTLKRVETVGEVHPHVEIKIVDLQTGAIVPRGTPGEFCTRGYSLMLGYWRNPEATQKSIDAARWMHTGDLAVMDDDGFVQVKGRIKEIVLKDGQIIFPRDIEEVVFRHPAVADVQVFAVPDKQRGQEIMAWVRCRPGQTTTEAELQDLCAQQLKPEQFPRYWRFVDAFPTNMAGKNVKYMMQEQVAAEGGPR
ncbi:MAG TPA: AMP-binding protein [Polyangiaceae bacterium]|nr:AMP-binding protein [Polyangiaceae bacterium]